MVCCQKEAGASEFVESIFRYWFIHAETLVVIMKPRIFFNHTPTGQHMRLSFSITKDPVKKNKVLMILPLTLKAGCPEVDGGTVFKFLLLSQSLRSGYGVTLHK